MCKNKLLIAAAGAGKTTYIVNQTKTIKNANVLITTYTEANMAEIKRKFNGRVPSNVSIMTWFSFLLQHGVRPYQSLVDAKLNDKRIGFHLTEKRSGYRYKGKYGGIYWAKKDGIKYYLTKDYKIYSDKITEFILECNKTLKNELIKRINRIYPYIFIDEVQDLVGWEFELIKKLLQSKSQMVLVGDPRQITYSTHPSLKHVKYRNGGIKEFIEIECNKNKELCIIDEKTLSKSYRNNEFICNFSSALYPNLDPSKPHEDKNFKNDMVKNKGIFLLKPKDLEKFTKKYKPQILKYQLAEFPDLNFGASKGLGFDRVLIYPTEKIRNYLIDGDLEALSTVKAKFYVAVTRARHSVAILLDYDDEIKYIDGIKRIKYKNIIGKMQNYEHTTK